MQIKNTILNRECFLAIGVLVSHAKIVKDMDVRFSLQMGRNATKWDKSGTFKDQFAVHFGSSRKLIFKKSQICPI